MVDILGIIQEPFTPKTEEDWQDLEGRARHIFKPRAPIDDQTLFAGRGQQIMSLIDVIYETGSHAILHGERGVGKTSLANVIKDKILGPAKYTTVLKVSCSPGDVFSSIWSNVFFGYRWSDRSVADVIAENPRPFTVYKVAESLGANRSYLVILDEFDRVQDGETKTLIADTIKYLSDNPVNFTVVVVGVGRSVDQLFGSHPSIQRCCTQIPMPRMQVGELTQIVASRVPRLGMSITDDVVASMIRFSQGLPGYMHLLGQLAAIVAIECRSLEIDDSHLKIAVQRAVELADESTRHEYHLAIRSTKTDNRYRQVLFACAKAKKNELGQFRAVDVCEPYSEVMERPMRIEHFARHLNAFCEQARGPALTKSGQKKGYMYQFSNPLLEPLVVMTGISETGTVKKPARVHSSNEKR
jgi:Cdc6-like AAA superfamily ATPase